MNRAHRFPGWALAAVIAAAATTLIAGCGSTTENGGAGGTATPSGSIASTTASPASPSSPSQAAPRSTSAPTPSVSVYFYSKLAHGRLAALPRTAAGTAVLDQSTRALLDGPTGDERDTGMSSQVPSGAKLHEATLDHGIASLELTGSSAAWNDAALAQIVFTATQFPSVRGVRVEVDGHDVAPASGPADHPLTRADFEYFSPQVLVESPLYGQTIHSPARIVGTANTFEAAFNVEITDWDGRIVASQGAMATSGSGTRGTFDITVPYTVDRAGLGELISFVYSAKDGSRIVISETPIFVAP
ncbi:MAG TPA: Gmad2 immunoglobulin-like domain-containing protein [Acidothermaceae bacterium]